MKTMKFTIGVLLFAKLVLASQESTDPWCGWSEERKAEELAQQSERERLLKLLDKSEKNLDQAARDENLMFDLVRWKYSFKNPDKISKNAWLHHLHDDNLKKRVSDVLESILEKRFTVKKGKRRKVTGKKLEELTSLLHRLQYIDHDWITIRELCSKGSLFRSIHPSVANIKIVEGDLHDVYQEIKDLQEVIWNHSQTLTKLKNDCRFTDGINGLKIMDKWISNGMPDKHNTGLSKGLLVEFKRTMSDYVNKQEMLEKCKTRQDNLHKKKEALRVLRFKDKKDCDHDSEEITKMITCLEKNEKEKAFTEKLKKYQEDEKYKIYIKKYEDTTTKDYRDRHPDMFSTYNFCRTLLRRREIERDDLERKIRKKKKKGKLL